MRSNYEKSHRKREISRQPALKNLGRFQIFSPQREKCLSISCSQTSKNIAEIEQSSQTSKKPPQTEKMLPNPLKYNGQIPKNLTEIGIKYLVHHLKT